MDSPRQVALNQSLDRLRAASLDASDGTAYVCGPPWFRSSSGILVGSPDPHAGQMIADTDTSLSEPDDHDEISDDRNALFLAEAWNFARMLLDDPALLAALRTAGTGLAEAEERVLPIAMAFLDKAAGEGLLFVNEDENGTPEMDAADLYCEIARRLGYEADAPEMLALSITGHAAIRAIPIKTDGGKRGNR